MIEGDWSAASGYEAGRQLAHDSGLTEVFAANDDMAIGLIRALADAGCACRTMSVWSASTTFPCPPT